ncbi:hypothetical protein [Luteolibacter sp. AS25]|uniref:hypothetical protein n=1 Tax=Luteolibacter sp. AS25 TaxID=3135776 RepID=UPI00398B5E95
MRQSIVEKIEEFGFKHGSGESWVACPECDVRSPRPLRRANDVLKCEKCGCSASVREWLMHGIETERQGKADEVPADTKITKAGDGLGGAVWKIPAAGKFDFFLLFGTAWLGITAVVSFAILAESFKNRLSEGDMPFLIIVPFLGVFWAIGLGVFFAGLKGMFQKVEISVSGGEFTLKKELFGRVNEQRCALESIKSVSQVVFYSKNKRPVYGIQVKADKKFKFGSALRDDEKAWLTADLEEATTANRKRVVGSYEPEERGRKDYFSVVIPDSIKARALGALIIFAVSILFLVLGLFVMDTGFPSTVPTAWDAEELINFLKDLFSSTFRTLWLCFSTLIACVAVYLFFKALGERGQEKRIEGNEAEVSLRTYKRGLVLKDRSFPRSRVTDIRATNSGSQNGRPMKRVDLIVTLEAIKIAGWMDGDEADALVAEVREALGVK